MRFHVLGVGSIGTLVSHHIRKTHPHVPISLITKHASHAPSTRLYPSGRPNDPSPSLTVERDGHQETSSNYDIEVWHNGQTGARAQLPIDRGSFKGRIGDDSPNGQIKSLIVCLKTNATMYALSILKPRISQSSVITLLQNGMGVFDDLCGSLWPDPATRPHFILGSTTHGATKGRLLGTVKHNTKAGEGEMKFGIVPDPRDEIDFEKWLWSSPVGAAPILAAPSSPTLPLPRPPATPTDLGPTYTTLEMLLSLSHLTPSLLPMPHMHHTLLLKLAINSVINPLTGILGAGTFPNGALFGNGYAHSLIRTLSMETSNVITAYLHSLSAPHSPPPDIIRLFSWEGIEKRVLSVIRQTAGNTSSMAADVQAGRLTEIDHINGYLRRLGKRLGLETPHHAMVSNMVCCSTQLINSRFVQPLGMPMQLQDKQPFGYRKLRTMKQLELEAKRLEVEERKVWVAEEQILEKRRSKAASRYSASLVRYNRLKEVTPRDKMVSLEEWSYMIRRKKVEMMREAGLSTSVSTEELTVYDDGLDPISETMSRTPPPPSSSSSPSDTPSSPSLPSRPGSSLSLPSSTTSSPQQPPNPDPTLDPPRPALPASSPPSGNLSSWMNQMISSAPRQERTWEVPATPPTVRGPVPKKKPQATETKVSIENKVSVDAITSAIESPSRPKPAPYIIPTARLPTTATTSSSPPLSSPLDSLISSAPRAERSWDVPGGTVTSYGVSGKLSEAVGIRQEDVTRKDLSRGGLGTSLDGLIAGAPRQEPTWTVETGNIKGEKGRFTTSRTSGS